MRNHKGFTTIELLTTLVILVVLAACACGALLDNRHATEGRALKNAQVFVDENQIAVKRMTCAGDADGDGYGSCTVVTSDGEKILLQCPSGWFDVNVFRARSCKEIDAQYKMGLPVARSK